MGLMISFRSMWSLWGGLGCLRLWLLGWRRILGGCFRCMGICVRRYMVQIKVIVTGNSH